MIVYRSARAESPHLGRGSFWTTSESHAKWFARWEARTMPGAGPSRIYRAEVSPDDWAMLDLTRPLGAVDPNALLEKADAFAERGIEWMVISEGPIEGKWWTVAVYLGDVPVPAELPGP